MATYINTSVLLKPQEIFGDNGEADQSKFAWLLLGNPTKDVALGNSELETGKTSHYPLNETWHVENGRMTFKNANVCGIAPANAAPKYKMIGTGEEDSDSSNASEVAEAITYSFPGNTAGENNLLYPLVAGGNVEDGEGAAATEGYSISPGYLALVMLLDSEDNEDATYEKFKEEYIKLWTVGGDGSTSGTFSRMEFSNANRSDIADEKVKVLVAYNVSNPTMVNQYNFTGFNVGSSSLTVSGLSSNN